MKNWPSSLRGPWRMLKNVLSSPWSALALLVWIGIRTLMGVDAEYGQHPAEWFGVRLAFALLAFSFVSRGLDSDASRAKLVWGLGLILFMGSLVISGGQGGVAVSDASGVTEKYLRPIGERIVPVHLGAQLGLSMGEGGRVANLSLGLSDRPASTAQLQLGGHDEVSLGPWAVHLVKTEQGDEPGVARIRVKSRESASEAIEFDARTGRNYPLAGNVQLSVLRINSDFLGLLGGAVQIQLNWPEGTETAWHFVEGTDLDTRHGTSPYVVELLSVASEPKVTIGVRQAGQTPLTLGALLILILAILMNFRQKEQA